MSLADDLARMEAENAAATPGPWKRENPHGLDCRSCNDGEGEHGGQDSIVGGPVSNYAGGDPDFDHQKEIITCDSGVYGPDAADATFICSARTDRPALVELVKLLTNALWACGDVSDPERSRIVNHLWSEAKRKALKP